MNNCGLTIREYAFDGEFRSDQFIVDVYMADYVEIITVERDRKVHNPYRAVPLYTGGVMLVSTRYYPDGKIKAHKHSVCPFSRCRHILGPLSSVKFVVRVVNAPGAPPIINLSE